MIVFDISFNLPLSECLWRTQSESNSDHRWFTLWQKILTFFIVKFVQLLVNTEPLGILEEYYTLNYFCEVTLLLKVQIIFTNLHFVHESTLHLQLSVDSLQNLVNSSTCKLLSFQTKIWHEVHQNIAEKHVLQFTKTLQ